MSTIKTLNQEDFPVPAADLNMVGSGTFGTLESFGMSDFARMLLECCQDEGVYCGVSVNDDGILLKWRKDIGLPFDERRFVIDRQHVLYESARALIKLGLIRRQTFEEVEYIFPTPKLVGIIKMLDRVPV